MNSLHTHYKLPVYSRYLPDNLTCIITSLLPYFGVKIKKTTSYGSFLEWYTGELSYMERIFRSRDVLLSKLDLDGLTSWEARIGIMDTVRGRAYCRYFLNFLKHIQREIEDVEIPRDLSVKYGAELYDRYRFKLYSNWVSDLPEAIDTLISEYSIDLESELFRENQP